MQTARTAPLESSDVLFDLGRINESEHLAYESLELFGQRPRILQRLVYIHVLKGLPDAARKFLGVLERSPLHAQWARDCRQQLDADPTLSSVPQVASRRELMLVRDSIGPLDLETMLQELLERNSQNRMAFEYLMAHHLLTHQLDKIAANVHRLGEFGYSALPRHVEEALLLLLETSESHHPELEKLTIRPETRRRFTEFLQAFERFGGNPAVAFVALHRDFGDSYFFYHTFGHNDLMFVVSKRSP
jgi:hypothetical protein